MAVPRILIFQQRYWGFRIGRFVAKRLQADGARLAALTSKPSADQYVRTQDEVHYECIDSHDAVMNDPLGYLGGHRYTLQQICDDLRCLENYVAAAFGAGFGLDYAGVWSGENANDRDLIIDRFVSHAWECLGSRTRQSA